MTYIPYLFYIKMKYISSSSFYNCYKKEYMAYVFKNFFFLHLINYSFVKLIFDLTNDVNGFTLLALLLKY